MEEGGWWAMGAIMACVAGAGFAIGDMFMIVGGIIIAAGCVLFASGILDEE